MIVDLFAGPGGWDTGLRMAGYEGDLVGVEWGEDACATAEAAGHRRVRADIATLDPLVFGGFWGLICSPPCQGFSAAGKGRGRLDLDALLSALALVRSAADVEAAIARLAGVLADPRSVLVLEPLRWLLAGQPSWSVWEQVPGAQVIWDACAAVLRRLGWTVATGVVSSEQFGVPQTRRRAVLVARAPWESAQRGAAVLPVFTHSRFVPGVPASPGVGTRAWVSMAEALGWSGRRLQSNYSNGGRGLGERGMDEPCFTITSKGPRWLLPDGSRERTLSIAERGVLQSFPVDYPWRGLVSSQAQQVGDAVPPLLARSVLGAVLDSHRHQWAAA